MNKLLCFLALSALLLSACTEGSCGETRVENLETGRCDCRAEYVEVVNEEGIDVCILRTDFDGGPDVGIDAPGFDAGPGTDGCTETTLYRDRDRDGRGDPDDSITACADPLYVDNADDCDDTCNVCWTGAEETCDTVDNDCDGFSDEGLTVPVGEPVMITTGEGALAQLTTTRVFAERLADGRYLLFYESRTLDGFVSRTFDVASGELGAETVVDDDDRLFLAPDVSSNGGLIAIVGYASAGQDAVRGRTYRMDGTPTAPAFDVVEMDEWISDGSYQAPVISLVPSGSGYEVAWLDANGNVFSTPVQNNLARPFTGPPRQLWDGDDGDVDWLSAMKNSAATVVATFQDGPFQGVAQIDLSMPDPDWEMLTTEPFATADTRRTTDAIELVGVRYITPGSSDDGFTLQYNLIDRDGVRSTQTLDDAAIYLPPLLTESPSTVASFRLSPTDRIVSLLRLDGTRQVISATANPAVPTLLGSAGVVYLEAGSDIGASDVAFRRFGCPD